VLDVHKLVSIRTLKLKLKIGATLIPKRKNSSLNDSTYGGILLLRESETTSGIQST
jgi:hypothetical protein